MDFSFKDFRIKKKTKMKVSENDFSKTSIKQQFFTNILLLNCQRNLTKSGREQQYLLKSPWRGFIFFDLYVLKHPNDSLEKADSNDFIFQIVEIYTCSEFFS